MKQTDRNNSKCHHRTKDIKEETNRHKSLGIVVIVLASEEKLLYWRYITKRPRKVETKGKIECSKDIVSVHDDVFIAGRKAIHTD